MSSRLAHFAIGAARPVPELAQGAARFAAGIGQHHDPAMFGSAYIHPMVTDSIAAAYARLPSWDRDAVPAYKAFRDETSRQFDFLTRPRSAGGLGIDVRPQSEDPYAGAAGMMRDVQQNRTLRIFKTGGEGNEHPFLSDDENDQFRAVHDAFGHAASGRGFDRHGEEAAYLSHAGMYGPLARQALATETRGQNSAFNVSGPEGAKSFPEQKVAMLPPHLTAGRMLDPMTGGGGALGAILQARQFHAAQEL